MNPEESIRRILGHGTVRTFGPGFSDRVMARLGSSRAAPLNAVLERGFRRLLPAALAAAMVLAALNLRQSRAGQNAIEAVLGLPAVTLATAFELGDTP